MKVSIIIATYGDVVYPSLAADRAYPSAQRQGANEIIAVHQTDGTLAGVRNACAHAATGDWLCFLDADDALERGYLAAMRAAQRDLSDAGYDAEVLLVPAVSYVTTQKSSYAASGYEQIASAPRVLNDGRPLHEINRAVIGTLIRREFFVDLGGFRNDLAALEDWELWLRAERAGAHLIDVSAAVYSAYARAGSRNSDQSLYQQIRREHLRALKQAA